MRYPPPPLFIYFFVLVFMFFFQVLICSRGFFKLVKNGFKCNILKMKFCNLTVEVEDVPPEKILNKQVKISLFYSNSFC